MLIQLRTASKTVLLHVTHCASERDCAVISRGKSATSSSEPRRTPHGTSQQAHAWLTDSSDKTSAWGICSRLRGDCKMCCEPNLRFELCAQRSVIPGARSRLFAPELLQRAFPRCCKYAVVAKWSPRGQALVMFAGYSIKRWRLSEPWPESEMPLVRPGDPLSGSLFCPKSCLTSARWRPRKRDPPRHMRARVTTRLRACATPYRPPARSCRPG
jgi:hypothetical protein